MQGNSSPSATRYEINNLQQKIGKTKIQIPSVIIDHYVYTGEAQGPTILGLDTIHTTTTNTTKVEVGESTLTIALTDTATQEWADGTVANKTYPYTVYKAIPNLTVSATDVHLDNTSLSADVVVTCDNESAILSAISNDSSIATVDKLSSATFRISGVTSGSTTVTISAAATLNYDVSNITISVTTDIVGELDDTSWERISQISASGMASSYWEVGDAKKVHVQGRIGYGGARHVNNLVLDDDLYVFIMEFDHNAEVEGHGISFGTFKTSKTSPDVVGLVDKYYMLWVSNEDDDELYVPEGYHAFSMYHDSDYRAYGGWRGCDLRYDILGSTNVAPSEYSDVRTKARVGYDATPTTATAPVPDTLMAALPADLRAVMKPITKYVPATGYSTEQGDYAIIPSIDYLPLLSTYELAKPGGGEVSVYQTQYEYYVNGNNRIRYAYGSTAKVQSGTAVYTFVRYLSMGDDPSWYVLTPTGNIMGFGVAGNKVLSISAVFLV